MGKRDWGGTVFVACLIALAGFLRDHTVPVILLSAGAVTSAAVVVWDVSKGKQRAKPHPLVERGARSIQRALRLADAADRLLGQEPGPHAEGGKVLLGEIGAEQITFRVQPWNMMLGMLLRNRTAEVERWAIAGGSTKAVPTAPDGKPTEMDYARLIAYVKEVMEDQ